jgi:hypothetical protein
MSWLDDILKDDSKFSTYFSGAVKASSKEKGKFTGKGKQLCNELSCNPNRTRVITMNDGKISQVRNIDGYNKS